MAGLRLDRLLWLLADRGRAGPAGLHRGELPDRPQAAGAPQPRPARARHRWQPGSARLLQIPDVHHAHRQRSSGRPPHRSANRAAARHLLLHVSADRLSGRLARRRRQGASSAPLPVLRQLFPPAHRRAHRPSCRGHASAAQDRRAEIRPGRLLDRADRVRDRPGQEGGDRDRLVPTADGVFDAALDGGALTLIEAWGGALAYALQIYFDFSGYSDMAIGLARMVGLRLPINFASPYKAASIIEFWSRWHITLTRFLTSYIYNPLSLRAARVRAQQGKPPLRRKGAAMPGAYVQILAVPTLVTMLLSGFWHGAGFQFILWGGLHGVFLAVNHGWRLMVLPRMAWRLPRAIS